MLDQNPLRFSYDRQTEFYPCPAIANVRGTNTFRTINKSVKDANPN